MEAILLLAKNIGTLKSVDIVRLSNEGNCEISLNVLVSVKKVCKLIGEGYIVAIL